MTRRGSSSWAEAAGLGRRSPRRPLGTTSSARCHRPRRLGALVGSLVASILLALVATAPAGAESPVLVAEALAVDGVWVAPGRGADVDEEAIAATIREARARGLRMVVAVPRDPQPTVAAFARRIQEASDADAALVFGPDGEVEAHVVDEFDSAVFRALAAARAKAAPADAVEAFSQELLTEPARSVPPIVGQVVTLVVLLALILAGAVALEQMLRRLVRAQRAKKRTYDASSA